MNNKETVLITGPTSGIGKSLTYRFAHHYNYDLVLVGRSLSRLEVLYNDLKKNKKITIYYFKIDLREKDSSKKIINFLEENSIKVTILINNAGIGQDNNLDNTSDSHKEDIINLNICSVVNLTKDLIPKFKKNGGGKILNVSSVVGFYPMPKSSIYSSSKAFINFFSEALRMELNKHNIKVSILCPGATNTSIGNIDNYYSDEKKSGTIRRINTSFAGVMDPNKVGFSNSFNRL